MPAFDSVRDSGKRQEFSTGSVRDTAEGKPRLDLIPPLLLRRLGQHFANGAKKYGDNNWQLGQPLSRYYGSAFNHLLCVKEGKEDEDHLSAAIWNLQALMWTLEEIREGRLPIALLDVPYCAAPRRITDAHDGPAVVPPAPGHTDLMIPPEDVADALEAAAPKRCNNCLRLPVAGEPEHYAWCATAKPAD